MENATNMIEPAKTLLDYAEQLGPTFVAIVAITVTFLVAKRQVAATTVSASRQRWIDSLRDDLPRLLSIGLSMSRSELDVDHNRRSIDEFSIVFFRIRLGLRSTDTHHSNLLNAITDYQACIVTRMAGNDPQELQEVLTKIIITGSKVIDQEWERITQGR